MIFDIRDITPVASPVLGINKSLIIVENNPAGCHAELPHSAECCMCCQNLLSSYKPLHLYLIS